MCCIDVGQCVDYIWVFKMYGKNKCWWWYTQWGVRHVSFMDIIDLIFYHHFYILFSHIPLIRCMVWCAFESHIFLVGEKIRIVVKRSRVHPLLLLHHTTVVHKCMPVGGKVSWVPGKLFLLLCLHHQKIKNKSLLMLQLCSCVNADISKRAL